MAENLFLLLAVSAVSGLLGAAIGVATWRRFAAWIDKRRGLNDWE